MSKPVVWIERDHAGRRFTLFDGSAAGISETCLRQPYMSEAEWDQKLRTFLQVAPDAPVYEDRFTTGELLGTASEYLEAEGLA